MPDAFQQVEKGTVIIYMTIPEFRNLGEDIRDFLDLLGFKQRDTTTITGFKLLQGTAEIFKDDTVVYVAQVPEVNLYLMEFTLDIKRRVIDIGLKNVNRRRRVINAPLRYRHEYS